MNYKYPTAREGGEHEENKIDGYGLCVSIIAWNAGECGRRR